MSHNCNWCGKTFETSSSSVGNVYCSRKCRTEKEESKQRKKDVTPSSGKSILGTLFSLLFKKRK